MQASIDLFSYYRTVEDCKEKPTLGFPMEFKYPYTCEKKDLNLQQLSGLQLYVESKSIGEMTCPTFEMFQMLETTNAARIATQLPYLREHGSKGVKMWLSSIDNRLRDLIRRQQCPPVIISKTTGLHRGNIPDGNHRVLAALELSLLYNEEVSLPAYVITSSSVSYNIGQGMILLDRLHSNPMRTLQLLLSRMRD